MFDTPAGPARYVLTDANHVYISAKPLRINNVEYSTVSIHLYADADWSVKNFNDIYMSRPDFKDPSHAAREKAQKVLVAAWREFIGKNPTLVLQAAVVAAEKQAAAANDKIGELQLAIEAEERKRDDARAAAHRARAALEKLSLTC